MLRRPFLFAAALVVSTASQLHASDPIGIYALVDSVKIVTPCKARPTVQIKGTFVLAVGRGFNYAKPVHGYLYYTPARADDDRAAREWADLKRVAGTGECVAFASRYKPRGKVRALDETPAKPDAYPINFGVRKMGSLNSQKRRLQPSGYTTPRFWLANFARPAASTVEKSQVKLTVRNAVSNNKDKRYYFEIKNEGGKTETSNPMVEGKKTTSWTPKMKIEPGKKYTWKAWIEVPTNTQRVPYKCPACFGSFTAKATK